MARLKMKYLIMLTCILCVHGAPESKHGCEFPEQWRGNWFQSGEKGGITINGTRISNKGQCKDSSKDTFLIYDTNQNCYRCLSMHEKHHNVIQYKETYCVRSGDLKTVCEDLTGDSPLFSLFRHGAAPSSCPFKGPLEFSYTRNDKDCKSPLSQADVCTQDSKLYLRYMACPDVPATESYNVELECLATWKDGSTQYFVARLSDGQGVANDETRYRCFAYAKSSNGTWDLAQSADASCNGLTSATDGGAKTLKMYQKSESARCNYPSWMVSAKSWVALDPSASKRLIAWTNNMTILDQDETQFACHSIIAFENKRTLSDVDAGGGGGAHVYSAHHNKKRIQLVARATRDCKNGYVCMVIHKRDDHVIEIQQSENWADLEDDACKHKMFNPATVPYTTFITMEPMTRQCPYLGRYDVMFVAKPQNNEYNDVVGSRIVGGGGGGEREHFRQNYDENVAEIKAVRATSRPAVSRCHNANGLSIGCTKPDQMEFATDCTDKALFRYSCHGTWVENDTTYLVASTEAGRYCLVYTATKSNASASTLELIVTGHLASCPRTARTHKHEWHVNLKTNGQCDDVSSASTWRSSGSSLTTHMLFVMGAVTLRYIAR